MATSSFRIMVGTLHARGWDVALALSVLGLAAVSCSSDDSANNGSAGATGTGGSGGAGLCVPGQTRACVGPGACQGGQACESDATWGVCDCGASSGGAPGGGGGPTGGAGGEPVADSGPDSSCSPLAYPTELGKDPVDVIFIVDNSCSMDAEIEAIEQNINQNFAQIITSGGLDYRMIVISEHGEPKAPSSYESSICIGPPIGGAPCDNVPQNTAPANNPPIFYHYDHDDVESWDSWCKMLDWHSTPDRYNLAPNGWGAWLRAGARKAFVEVTDDRVDCMYPPTNSYYAACSANGPKCFDDTSPGDAQLAAQQFDQELLALNAAQFGTAQSRNYVWHSFIGVTVNTANPLGAYLPTDPMVTAKCETAVNTGPAYQGLSMLTGGLRFPVCDGTGFAGAFKALAERIMGDASRCEAPIPNGANGKPLDPAALTLQYTVGTSTPTTVALVSSATQCGPNAFYVVAPGDAGAQGALALCPALCTQLKYDPTAQLEVLAACK